MHGLEDDPMTARTGADLRLLWGHDDPPLYRLRAGDYRVLYFVLPSEVRVTEVVHRSQAYRGLELVVSVLAAARHGKDGIRVGFCNTDKGAIRSRRAG